MSDLNERVAYLQGLASGFNMGEGSKEARVLAEVLDVIDMMAKRIDELEAEQEDLKVYVESLDSDLAELEDDYYSYQDEDENGGNWEAECPHCGSPIEYEEEEDYEDEHIDLTCPECGALINRVDGASGRAAYLTGGSKESGRDTRS